MWNFIRIILYNIFLIVCIIIFVCAEYGRVLKGEAQEMAGGGLQDQDMGFYSTRLNSALSQCARGKPSIAQKPEDHLNMFKW